MWICAKIMVYSQTILVVWLFQIKFELMQDSCNIGSSCVMSACQDCATLDLTLL